VDQFMVRTTDLWEPWEGNDLGPPGKHVTNTQGKQSALGSLPATRLDPKFTI